MTEETKVLRLYERKAGGRAVLLQTGYDLELRILNATGKIVMDRRAPQGKGMLSMSENGQFALATVNGNWGLNTPSEIEAINTEDARSLWKAPATVHAGCYISDVGTVLQGANASGGRYNYWDASGRACAFKFGTTHQTLSMHAWSPDKQLIAFHFPYPGLVHCARDAKKLFETKLGERDRGSSEGVIAVWNDGVMLVSVEPVAWTTDPPRQLFLISPSGTIIEAIRPPHPISCMVAPISDDGGAFAYLEVLGENLHVVERQNLKPILDIAPHPGESFEEVRFGRSPDELLLLCGFAVPRRPTPEWFSRERVGPQHWLRVVRNGRLLETKLALEQQVGHYATINRDNGHVQWLDGDSMSDMAFPS